MHSLGILLFMLYLLKCRAISFKTAIFYML